MPEKPDHSRWSQWAAALDAALGETEAALAAGEPIEAERRAKAVSAFAKAIRDAAALADYAREAAPEEDAEAIRAELRRRVARFIEAEQSGAALETLERGGAGASRQ